MTPAGLDRVVLMCGDLGLPIPECEARFHPTRRWRADYLWRAEKVILEIDGGIYRGGRRGGMALGGHSSVGGILRDMEKSNAAQLLGYKFLRATPQEVTRGTVIPMLTKALRERP